MGRRPRHRSFRLPRRPWQAIAVVVVLAALAAVQQWRPRWLGIETAPLPSPAPPQSSTVEIARVVDGDTLVLTGTKERVRLIGADTPETVKPNHPVEPWGAEACVFTKAFLAGGKLRLEFDGPRQDKYGRTLAYVWVGDRMLNEELLREGLARAKLNYSFSEAMKERFRRAEAEARSARRGIWSSSDGRNVEDR